MAASPVVQREWSNLLWLYHDRPSKLFCLAEEKVEYPIARISTFRDSSKTFCVYFVKGNLILAYLIIRKKYYFILILHDFLNQPMSNQSKNYQGITLWV